MSRAFRLRVLLPFLLAALCSAPAPATNRPADKAQELKAVKGRIDKLKREIESAEGSKVDVLDELKQSEQSISQINRALYDLERQLQAVNADLSATRRESEALRARIEAQRSQLARLLVQQYEAGGQDALRLLLNQQDPNRISRDIDYYGYIARARSQLIADLKRNLAAAEAAARETREKSQELARLQEQQKQERQALQKEAAKRRSTLARLEQQIAARRQQVQRLEQDEKRLTQLIERLARARAAQARARAARGKGAPQAGDSGEFARLKGLLKLPVNGDITNRFGAPRAETGIPWKGVFIRAAEGSPVKALAGGRVVFADWLRGFGNLLIIEHEDGYMSLYGYNEALYKRVGDSVRAGDVISAAGNSGGNAESGLYFEVRFQGKPVDPLQWVGKR